MTVDAPEVISPWPAIPIPCVADWYPLPNTEGCYEFSVYRAGDTRPLGWVRSWLRGSRALRAKPRLIRLTISRSGYRHVSVCYPSGEHRSRPIHQLCLEVYAGTRPPGAITRHLDDNKLNNHPDNLRWGIHRENSADSIRNGTNPHGERAGRAKLRNEDITSILLAALNSRPFRTRGELHAAIAKSFGVSANTIQDILNGNSWRQVTAVEPNAGLLEMFIARRSRPPT